MSTDLCYKCHFRMISNHFNHFYIGIRWIGVFPAGQSGGEAALTSDWSLPHFKSNFTQNSWCISRRLCVSCFGTRPDPLAGWNWATSLGFDTCLRALAFISAAGKARCPVGLLELNFSKVFQLHLVELRTVLWRHASCSIILLSTQFRTNVQTF